jgi:ubiquinol-cytochrome c reductase iron-sulfur subunit
MSTPTSVPAGELPAGVDKERRNAIAVAAAVGGAGAVAMAVPFVASFAPSERAKAAGAPVEFDVGGMAPGEMKTVEWRGLPVWVLRRTPEMLQSIKKVDGEVADPKSQRTQYPTPEYAQNEFRSRKPEYLIAVGICTHLGCSPAGPFAPNQNSQLGADQGFLCPCHGSTFDLAGRVFKNKPAPDNLPVPPHKYLSDTLVLIGDDSNA